MVQFLLLPLATLAIPGTQSALLLPEWGILEVVLSRG